MFTKKYKQMTNLYISCPFYLVYNIQCKRLNEGGSKKQFLYHLGLSSKDSLAYKSMDMTCRIYKLFELLPTKDKRRTHETFI